MTLTKPYLFTAVHKGPYLSIRPLEAELGEERVLYLVEGVAKQERAQQGLPYLSLGRLQESWGSIEGFLRQRQVAAVVRSSSEDGQEPNVERMAAVAAKAVGMPVFVIEDFPGNYWLRGEERLDGLFVEDGSLAELHRSRGVGPQVIHPTGNPRYNDLMSLDPVVLRLKTRRVLGLRGEPVMLWAGQPDGDNSYQTLERLLKAGLNQEVTLMFRAHPRDEAYNNGKYKELLAQTSMKVLDVSSRSDILGLYCASDLVVSQFSSAGVEASHLGVPALFVLFDDLGKRYLRTFKGYDSLLWCDQGGAYLIDREESVLPVMRQALFDQVSRRQVCANFQRRFGAGTHRASAIADQIRSVVGEHPVGSR